MAAATGAGGEVDARARIRAGRLALAVSLAVLLTKLVAWRVTDSTAVLSDALESVVNVVAAALLLYSLQLAAQPADRNHPYGHGKVEFFSAGVEGTLIGVAALIILVKAVRALWLGPELARLDLGLVLVTAASAVNAGFGAYLLRLGRRSQSLALEADGRHLLTDVATSAGVIAGLLLVRLTGWTLLDPLVAIGVAIHILGTGWQLLRRAVSGLMDEADPELLGRMVAALERWRPPGCIDVHSLRAWRSGTLQHADVHLVVPRYLDADRLHTLSDEIEAVLVAAAGAPGEAIVHFDPCRPRHCRACGVCDCPVRGAPSEGTPPITLDRATRGDETLDSGAPTSPLGAP